MKIFANKRWLVLCAVTAGLIFAGSANASTYECRELERVSVSAGGMMQPAYPGRELVFTRDGNVIESNFFKKLKNSQNCNTYHTFGGFGASR